MGKVTGNWLTGVHSGRACRHESIYTKVNKKTGKCYSAKLCNPNTNATAAMLSHRAKFGRLCSAINTWVNEQKAANSAAYQTLTAQFEYQTKYSTLRGYMLAKNMAEVVDEDTVRITVAGETFDIAVGTSANANSNSQNSNSQSSNANVNDNDNSGSAGTSTSGGSTDTGTDSGSTSGGSSSSASTTDGDNFN